MPGICLFPPMVHWYKLVSSQVEPLDKCWFRRPYLSINILNYAALYTGCGRCSVSFIRCDSNRTYGYLPDTHSVSSSIYSYTCSGMSPNL